jgi:hypothetical protein
MNPCGDPPACERQLDPGARHPRTSRPGSTTRSTAASVQPGTALDRRGSHARDEPPTATHHTLPCPACPGGHSRELPRCARARRPSADGVHPTTRWSTRTEAVEPDATEPPDRVAFPMFPVGCDSQPAARTTLPASERQSNSPDELPKLSLARWQNRTRNHLTATPTDATQRPKWRRRLLGEVVVPMDRRSPCEGGLLGEPPPYSGRSRRAV